MWLFVWGWNQQQRNVSPRIGLYGFFIPWKKESNQNLLQICKSSLQTQPQNNVVIFFLMLDQVNYKNQSPRTGYVYPPALISSPKPWIHLQFSQLHLWYCPIKAVQDGHTLLFLLLYAAGTHFCGNMTLRYWKAKEETCFQRGKTSASKDLIIIDNNFCLLNVQCKSS